MSKKKKNNNSNHDQLELDLIFTSLDSQDNKENNQDQSIVTKSINNQQNHKDSDVVEHQTRSKNSYTIENIHPECESNTNDNLFLPFTYEAILKVIGENKARLARLPDFIVPVTKFEEQIIQVLADIKNNGYLLFLYGVSGVGKSTFISSLQSSQSLLKFQKDTSIRVK